MSRKSRRKAKKAKPSPHRERVQPPLPSTYEKFTDDPTPILPFGADLTPEAVKQFREQTLEWMVRHAHELEQLLLQFNAFDMIANLWVSQLWADPEHYREATHQGLAAVVEYVALLYLKHPYLKDDSPIIDASVLQPVEEKTRGLLQATVMYYLADTILQENATNDSVAFARLRYKAILGGIFVRSPGYRHHHMQRVSALFIGVDEFLLKEIGFTTPDALMVNDAIIQLIEHRLIERRQQAVVDSQELRKRVKLSRASKTHQPNVDGEIVDLLVGLSGKQAKKKIRDLTVFWVFDAIGVSVFSFAAQDIVAECKLPLARVEAVLGFFSTEFQSVPPAFVLFSPTHELTLRPLIRYDQRFMYPIPDAIIWAVQPRVEEVLKHRAAKSQVHGSGVWETYQDNRAEYLESQSLRALEGALKHATAFRNLRYVVEANGVALTAELDALVIFDTTLFLVEMKAGEFTPPAKRGAKDRLRRDFKKLITDAHHQAQRAKEFIESNSAVDFSSSNSQKITIRRADFRRVFLVAVSLEPLDIYHANLHEAIEAGLVDIPTMPWSVSLDVLQVICEHIEFPVQFIHYLERRLRVTEIAKISAHDELDLFGNYLSSGLYYDDVAASDESYVHLLSHTAPFDDYYFYEMGLRKKPAGRFQQKMPALYRQLLLELEAKAEDRGYSEVLLQLLDWNGQSRDEFIRLFLRVRALATKDRRTHDMSMVSNTLGGLGVTCFATVYAEQQIAFENLAAYVRLKKYQQRADSWLGLLSIVEEPGYIHAYITSGVSPWRYDQSLEDLVKRLDASPNNASA